MRTNEFLVCLNSVRPRGPGKWSARCPAHEDRNPSLSVREGERGLLVRCWAGCELQKITEALGLRISDLFFGAVVTRQAQREIVLRRDADRCAREQAQHERGLEIDRAREAEQLVLAARAIDISPWPDDALNRALNQLADAYGVLEREEALHERG